MTRTPSEVEKILVAYFSHSGNTRAIANQIHDIAGGEIFEIRAVQVYPDDYDAVVKKARQELDSGFKPPLNKKIENVASYDLVFLGYPNWWNTFPAPVKTFLSEYDLSGKVIAPFCTHEGSGFGRSVSDIAKLCPNSSVLGGISIRGGSAKTAQGKVSDWLKNIRLNKRELERS